MRISDWSSDVCSSDLTEGVVLSGDHILPTITPHISGLGSGADPLAEFFRSLEKVGALVGVTLTLPAHGHPFPDPTGRATAIREHHEERLEVLRAAADELGSGTGAENGRAAWRERVCPEAGRSGVAVELKNKR